MVSHGPSRFLATAIIFLVTFLGFGSKFYPGPGAWWVNDHLAGVFYEIFWCLVVFFVAPRASPFWVASGVFLATCLVEFLQLVHTPLLQAIRSTFIGRVLIGTHFGFWDFPHYAAGCFVGWLLMGWLGNRGRPERST
jgi:hypothetical protein